MLKTLWVIDALLLLGALGLALLARGMDAAGRGILWVVPLVLGAALAASFAANRSGSTTFALVVAMIGPAIAAGVFLTLGRSLLQERNEQSGRSYWRDPSMVKLATTIVKGDAESVRAAAAGVNVNAEGNFGMTLLDFTIARRPDMVATVLQLGADPNRVVSGQLAPLAQALNAPDPAFQHLLAGGADPNGPGENEGAPILFSAIRSGQSIRYADLVAHGADVHRRDEEGNTSLMTAAEAREWQIAVDLLKRGVNPDLVNTAGKSLRSILESAHSGNRRQVFYEEFMRVLKEKSSSKQE